MICMMDICARRYQGVLRGSRRLLLNLVGIVCIVMQTNEPSGRASHMYWRILMNRMLYGDLYRLPLGRVDTMREELMCISCNGNSDRRRLPSSTQPKRLVCMQIVPQRKSKIDPAFTQSQRTRLFISSLHIIHPPQHFLRLSFLYSTLYISPPLRAIQMRAHTQLLPY
jgi:hypothetical protein